MNFWKYIFGIALFDPFPGGNCFSELPDQNLHVIACNVGLGDAVLVVYGKTQILTDGGLAKVS